MDTYDRIDLLLKKNKIKPAQLSRETGISTSLLTQWKQRLQVPSAEKLKVVADYFGVTTDYLLGNDPPIKSPIDLIDKEGFELFRNLSGEKKRQALDYLRFLHDTK